MPAAHGSHATLCAEFPNDNPALHDGAIWVCPDVTGAVACEPGVAARFVVDDVEIEIAPSVEATGDVETDDVESGDDIEIVDEIAMDDAIDESVPPPPLDVGDAPATRDDPFAALVAVMEGVARDAGANDGAIANLRVVLGRSRVNDATGDDLLTMREQATAWQGILRGESEDFAACGASALDEWAAIAVARAMREPARTDGLRRELRRRGVAAFGIVVEAA